MIVYDDNVENESTTHREIGKDEMEIEDLD